MNQETRDIGRRIRDEKMKSQPNTQTLFVAPHAGEEKAEKKMPVTNEIADCMPLLDALYLCLTPPNQAKHYYRFSEFDDCARQVSDMKLCSKAKMLSNEDEARKLVAGYKFKHMDMREEKNSPTKGAIWEFKQGSEKGWGK